jgi:hypothetical protein
MTMIPAWLQRHLENTGRWNTDGISRAVHAGRCRCGACVLRGLDGERCALAATADPGPLDPAGEMQALIIGRATYWLRHIGGRWEIDRRSSFDIAAQPAGTVDVIAEHKCGTAIPANGPPIKNPAPRIARSDELCPY